MPQLVYFVFKCLNYRCILKTFLVKQPPKCTRIHWPQKRVKKIWERHRYFLQQKNCIFYCIFYVVKCFNLVFNLCKVLKVKAISKEPSWCTRIHWPILFTRIWKGKLFLCQVEIVIYILVIPDHILSYLARYNKNWLPPS